MELIVLMSCACTHPTLTTPTCWSTVNSLLFVPRSCSFEVTNFCTANTTPSFTRRAIAVLRRGYGDTLSVGACSV